MYVKRDRIELVSTFLLSGVRTDKCCYTQNYTHLFVKVQNPSLTKLVIQAISLDQEQIPYYKVLTKQLKNTDTHRNMQMENLPQASGLLVMKLWDRRKLCQRILSCKSVEWTNENFCRDVRQILSKGMRIQIIYIRTSSAIISLLLVSGLKYCGLINTDSA